MRCEEAAEFVSALYDGETVPREAAEHIGNCPVCQAQLHTYMDMGVELRRLASLATPQDVATQKWKAETARPGAVQTWWRKGWETMRIPRFAFAAMVAGILVLASGLALTRVRARSEGSVAMLKVRMPGAENPILCPLSLEDKTEQKCDMSSGFGKGTLSYLIRLLGDQDGRLTLGIRTTAVPTEEAIAHGNPPIMDAPQNQYDFTPGETLRVAMGSFGDMQISGEWMDHMPPFSGGMNDTDPGLDETRIISPILIRGDKVIADWSGMAGTARGPANELKLYAPGFGRFQFYTQPHPGAVEGKVEQNRVSFSIDNEPYKLVTGLPITRTTKFWVKRNPTFRPSKDDPAAFSIGGADAND